MRDLTAIFASILTICLTASSQTVRDLPLNAPVDAQTIATSYAAISNAVATAVRLGQLDQASLARAVAVGQDLHLVETTEAGWVVGVSNIVNVQQAHVPGVLFVGDTIYGSPSSGKGRIDLDGCDFYYNRQIPGDGEGTNGWGNIVTDPYLRWWERDFFAAFAATNDAAWNAMMSVNNLPASLGADLRAYSSATGQINQAISSISGIRDEVVAAGETIQSDIEDALSRAEGGTSWTHSTVNSYTISVQDHQNITCPWSGSLGDTGWTGITIELPSGDGTKHCRVTFTDAGDMGYQAYNGDGVYVSFASDDENISLTYDGDAGDDIYNLYRYNPYYGDAEFFSVIVYDMFEYDVNCWMVKRYFSNQYYPW